MLNVIRIFFVLLASIIGFLLSDTVNLDPILSLLLGATGSLLIIIIDIYTKEISLQDIIAGVLGLTAGLVIASLLSYAVSSSPYFGTGKLTIIPLLLYLVLGYFGTIVALKKKSEFRFLSHFLPGAETGSGDKILDTSVIIDGRIADIIDIGFLEGPLVVPNFVLQELQRIADSSDPLKRSKGRRGLEILNRIKSGTIKIKISDFDVPNVPEVDDKLIHLAKNIKGKIVTNDFNLNKVAKFQGIDILNINDLSNALKPVFLAGEPLHIKVIKDGKEAGQGIAYLDDGTMVVVEGGKAYVGQTIDAVVTSVLQTAAGRMVFTKKKEDLYRWE